MINVKRVFSALSVSLLLVNHSLRDLRHRSAFSFNLSSDSSFSNRDVSSAIMLCLLNRLFRCRSKKTSKLRITDLCAGNSQIMRKMFDSPHKGLITQKMFPFDDIIMLCDKRSAMVHLVHDILPFHTNVFQNWSLCTLGITLFEGSTWCIICATVFICITVTSW